MSPIQAPIGALLLLALAAPGAALAYGEKDAVRDCESRIRSEYRLSDLRDAHAQRLTDSEHHYNVQGFTKVDGERHPWSCEIKNRHVTMAEYSGPKPKGMGTAEKLAIGAAAAVAAGVAISEASKHGGESHSKSGGSGAAGLQDLVGARGSSGEAELKSRGYTYVKGEKGGDSSYTNWRKGSHCVTVRTVDGRYKSIVDVTMADCGTGGSHGGGEGAGAAGLQDLMGARGSSGEAEIESRGYKNVLSFKDGQSSYTNWRKGSHCVSVRTTNGHYDSIIDIDMADCK